MKGGMFIAIGIFWTFLGAQGQDSLLQVPLRQLDAEKLEEYAQQPEFRYEESPVQPSLWQRFLRWLTSYLEQDEETSETFWTGLSYVLAALAIGLILFQLVRVPIQGLWAPKATVLAQGGAPKTEEALHALDFDAMIAQAIEDKAYRRALRLLYLESLKLLSTRELISWQPYKPNSVYQAELAGSPLAEPFRKMTETFEYVWYGDFELTAQRFEKTRQAFQQFRKDLE